MNMFLLPHRKKTPILGLLMMKKTPGGSLTEYTETGNPVAFQTNVKKPLTQNIIHFSPVQASGTPSPDNPLPITGWTEVKEYLTDSSTTDQKTIIIASSEAGVNRWDEQWELGALQSSNGSNYSSNTQIRSRNYIPIEKNTTYYFNTSDADGYALVFFYDENKNIIAGYHTGSGYTGNASYVKNETFTTPPDGAFMRFYMTAGYGITYNNDLSINYPATSTAYQQYINTDTVYGGYADLVNGTLVVTHASYVYDGSADEGWSNTASSYYIPNPNKISQKPICNRYNGVSPIAYASLPDLSFALTTSPHNYINFKNSSILSLANWVAELETNPLTVVMQLVNPLVYRIDPITISTFIGENTISSDANGDIEIKYLKRG